MATRQVLKRGTLGDVVIETENGRVSTIRDFEPARWRWLARRLAAHEANVLLRLEGLDGIPSLISFDRARLIRSFVSGAAMHSGPPPSLAYFRNALRLLRLMHRRRVVHNDLAKEANWIHREGDRAGIVDFQLAICFVRRNRWFRSLAREDLRHLLKHKRHYHPDSLSARQQAILARPSWPARAWRALFKPPYRLVTRRLLGWPERADANERQRTH